MRPALFALALLPVLAVAQPPAKFRSEDGKFAVQFPGKPTEEKKPIRPGSSTHIHITQYDDADGARLVLWNEITAKLAIPGKILAGAAEGIAKQGQLVSDKQLTFDGDKYPARDVTVDHPKGYRLRTLLIVAHNRLYQVTVTGSNEFVAGPKAVEFRKSFELLK